MRAIHNNCSPKDRFLADTHSLDKAELLLSMNLCELTEVYRATERNMKLWLKGLSTMGSTVFPRLVQWAITSPKDRFLADIRSSDKAELLLSMNLVRLTQVYGATERNVRSWLHVLTECESTVSPQLVEWVDDLVTLPKDRFLADILTAGDRNMLLSMNVTSSEKGSGVMSMSVTDLTAEYGVTESTVNTWLKAISQRVLIYQQAC